MKTINSFEEFVRERKYLKNVSLRTLGWYQEAWRSWGKLLPDDPKRITQKHLTTAIVKMRETGITAVTVNTRLRVMNAWLRWMCEQKIIKERLKAPRQIEEQKDPVTFRREQIVKLVKGTPRSYRERRIITLVELILDTGIRIQEALRLRCEDINMDEMTIRVFGKGRKERAIPLSQAGRRILYIWISRWCKPGCKWVFSTRNGTALAYHNAKKDFMAYCERIGVEGAKLSFHPLRHTFATNYIRNGGDVFRLQRILGHTTLAMTRRYVSLQTADLTAEHQRLSPLAQVVGS